MPGFTHMQTAQPVSFGHHCLAYVEMLARDRGRFADARKRVNELPLGAAALAGTSFPIDRADDGGGAWFRPSDGEFARRRISTRLRARNAGRVRRSAPPTCRGSPKRSSSGSARASASSRLSDRFTTGSSIMPQKRNPDAAELIRAKAGRISGAFVSLLMVMKGLPLAYSKDMQEDKEAAFLAIDALTARARRHDRHGRRHGAEPGEYASGRSLRASRQRPILPIGSSVARGCPSAKRTT